LAKPATLVPLEKTTGEGHRGVALGRTSNGGEMLVLTRKTNQSIMIGDDVEVSVLAVSRDKIRLGITAPRDVPVFRKEVYLSIKGEQEAEGKNGKVSGAVGEALDELAKSE
jgi:carbon storage regulator